MVVFVWHSFSFHVFGCGGLGVEMWSTALTSDLTHFPQWGGRYQCPKVAVWLLPVASEGEVVALRAVQ